MINNKTELRQLLLARRKALGKPEHAQFSKEASFQLIKQLNAMTDQVFGLYWPLGHELDCLPLMRTLRELGAKISLPVTRQRGTPLTFYEWGDEVALQKSEFGVMEPPEEPQKLVEPSVVVVPLLGFDRRGYRLGYGAGFYDCTIARWRKMEHHVLTIGLGFSLQEVTDFPREDHDRRLDLLVTELGVIEPSSA